jgi:hypothetical protein
MKRLRRAVAAGAIILMLATGVRASSPQDTYEIDWYTIDNGGGQAGSGAYVISGTIGQADAGVVTGGVYTLEGGFWPGAVAEYDLYLPMIRR